VVDATYEAQTRQFIVAHAPDALQTRTLAESVYDTASDTGCWPRRGSVIRHAEMTSRWMEERNKYQNENQTG